MEDLVDGGGSHGGSVRGQQGFPIQVDGQVGEHRAGVVDDGLVLGVQAVDQPAHERDLGEELGSREDVQVDGAALMSIGLTETLEERIGGGGLNPRNIQGRVTHVRAGPPADSDDRSAINRQAAFLDVAVDGGRRETPQ